MLELKVNTNHHGETTLKFEHSLLSLSKWEQKTGKVFHSNSQKTPDEMLSYWQMMLLPPDSDPDLVYALSPKQQEQLVEYINSTPGATAPPPKTRDAAKGSTESLTAEIVYTQMIMLRIPWEAQEWHINRLLVTIAWVAYKQTPEKEQKRSVREKLSDWSSMNEANKKFFNSNG